MKDSIFRKESIDRLKSPEQLNDYIRVARPGVWIVLSAIVLLLIGVLIWGIFGSVETVVHTEAVVEDQVAVCSLDTVNAAEVVQGLTVSIDGQSGTIQKVSQGVAIADMNGLEDGVYQADITLERIAPIKLVIQ